MTAWKLPLGPVALTASKAACCAALALAAAGCADLQLLTAGQCGNQVLEGELGEDCDGEGDCGPPGTARECRITCETAPGTPCGRDGYRCGTDGVCRRPSGELSVMGSFTTATALDVFSGDVNLDGCHELFLTTRQAVEISAFASREPGRCPASEQSLPFGQAPEKGLSRSAPFLSDVTGDGRGDLLRPGDAQFEDSLFVHVAGATPEVAPILYPTVKVREEKLRPLAVGFEGGDALLLFIDNPMGPGGGGGGMTSVGISGVLEAQDIPINLGFGLPGRLDELVILSPAELGTVELLPGQAGTACTTCEEVLAGFAGGTSLFRISLRVVDGTMAMAPPEPVITLPAGAKLRGTNAAIAFLDDDMDNHLDAVVNTEGGGVFIAYGTGDGRFHSTSPPDLVAPDGKASPLLGAPLDLEDKDFVLVAGEFDLASPGLELEPVLCPPSGLLESAACEPVPGGCEVVVVDIDMDGKDDIVSTEHQQPGVVVRRSAGSTGFQTSFVDTQCPVHQLTSGDLDNDGVDDVAFFDQVRVSTAPGEPDKPVTTLMIAYGNAFAAPSPPAESGRFERAQGLTAGRFSGSGQGAGLYAARGIDDANLKSGVALVEGYGERHVFAPFYFPPKLGTGQSFIEVELPAAVGGRFVADPETGGARAALAAMTLDHTEGGPDGTPGSERLWLIDGSEGGSILAAVAQQGAAPPPCAQCVLVPIDVPLAGSGKDGIDELLLLGDGEAVLFSAGAEVDAMSGDTFRFFEERSSFKTTRSFSSVDRVTKPDKHTPRPLVADLDGDGALDIVLRAEDGSLAVLWAQEDGGFVEGELIPAERCGGKCSAALIDIDGESPRELVVLRPGGGAAGDGVEVHHVTASRTLEAAAVPEALKNLAPGLTADFTAIVAADLDGDGVEDLALMNSSNLVTALRVLPRTE